jgi:hypothetical protein
MLSRRALLAAGLGMAAAAVPVPGAVAQPRSGIAFDLLRSGDEIGSHRMAFRAEDGRLEVETRIDVTVSLLSVALFVYRHRGVETYRDGRLVRYRSETVDDDSEFFVDAEASPDGFVVTNKKGTWTGPQSIMVASYWHPRVLAYDTLLDPQRGRMKPQVIEGSRRVTETLAGAPVSATRYALSGVVNGTVTYDDDGRWVGASLVKKGADIVYRLRS